MEKFIESFDDFKGNIQIEEASEIAEFNEKIKKMGDDAKEARELASKAKDTYEKLTKEGEHAKAKLEMLKHTKYKAKSAMLNASVDIMLIEKGQKPKDDDKEEKKEDKKDKE